MLYLQESESSGLPSPSRLSSDRQCVQLEKANTRSHVTSSLGHRDRVDLLCDTTRQSAAGEGG